MIPPCRLKNELHWEGTGTQRSNGRKFETVNVLHPQATLTLRFMSPLNSRARSTLKIIDLSKGTTSIYKLNKSYTAW